MSEQSRLLIHEELLADLNPSERVTGRDFAMMAQFAVSASRPDDTDIFRDQC